MAAPRAAKKSQRKSPSGAVLRGVALDPSLRGRGPKKGAPNAGRPPNEHLEWCRRMVSSPGAEKAVEAVLEDAQHPAFSTMWKAVAERAYGKPAQAVTVSGPNGGAVPLAVEVTRRIVDPAAP